MKKIIVLLLIASLFIGFCSCDNRTNNGDQDKEQDNNQNMNQGNDEPTAEENPLYTDTIEPDEVLKLHLEAIYIPPNASYYPSEYVVIRNNEFWGDSGGLKYGALNYLKGMTFEIEGSIQSYITTIPGFEKVGETFDTLASYKSCYFIRTETSSALKGMSFLYRIGDEIFVLSGEFMSGELVNKKLFVEYVFYAKIDPELDFEPLRTDPIELNSESKITANNIVENAEPYKIEITIKNGELWDNAGDRFYGNVTYVDYYYNEYYFDKVKCVSEMYDEIWDNEDYLPPLNLISTLGSCRAFYFVTTELKDSPLGESCLICRFGKDTYIISGEYCELCRSFVYDKVFYVSEWNQASFS